MESQKNNVGDIFSGSTDLSSPKLENQENISEELSEKIPEAPNCDTEENNKVIEISDEEEDDEDDFFEEDQPVGKHISNEEEECIEIDDESDESEGESVLKKEPQEFSVALREKRCRSDDLSSEESFVLRIDESDVEEGESMYEVKDPLEDTSDQPFEELGSINLDDNDENIEETFDISVISDNVENMDTNDPLAKPIEAMDEESIGNEQLQVEENGNDDPEDTSRKFVEVIEEVSLNIVSEPVKLSDAVDDENIDATRSNIDTEESPMKTDENISDRNEESIGKVLKMDLKKIIKDNFVNIVIAEGTIKKDEEIKRYGCLEEQTPKESPMKTEENISDQNGESIGKLLNKDLKKIIKDNFVNIVIAEGTIKKDEEIKRSGCIEEQTPKDVCKKSEEDIVIMNKGDPKKYIKQLDDDEDVINKNSYHLVQPSDEDTTTKSTKCIEELTTIDVSDEIDQNVKPVNKIEENIEKNSPKEDILSENNCVGPQIPEEEIILNEETDFILPQDDDQCSNIFKESEDTVVTLNMNYNEDSEDKSEEIACDHTDDKLVQDTVQEKIPSEIETVDLGDNQDGEEMTQQETNRNSCKNDTQTNEEQIDENRVVNNSALPENEVSEEITNILDEKGSNTTNNEDSSDDTVENFEDEVQKSSKIEDDDISMHSPEKIEDSVNLEEIRNSLKMQLSSLRTRRKNHILQPMMTKVVDSDMEFNKKITEVGMSETTTDVEKITEVDMTETTTNVEKISDVDEKVSEPDVASIQIEEKAQPLEGDNNCDKILSTPEVQNHEELNVFDEIRKIIRSKKDAHKSVENASQISNQVENETTILPHSNESSSSAMDLGKEETQHTSTNSPFISNTLDEFLTENSKLNVSYKIPQSMAEEGLANDYCNESHPVMMPKYEEIKQEFKSDNEPVKKFKAKTLAEKRKLLEKNRLKEERKMGRLKKRQEKENFENGNCEKSKRSFILYHNKKIWVKSTKPDHCFASIGTNIQQHTIQNVTKRPSLLDHLKHSNFSRLKYKPGPLCRKSQLQVGSDDWFTVTKPLPKICLEVIPEIGKPFTPSILHRLPQHDGKISDSLIDMALSVLKCKDANQRNIFKFDLAYANNQEEVLVVKKKRKVQTEKYKSESKSLETEISDVVDNLLNYVETKMLEPFLIKDEMDSFLTNPESNQEKPAEISDSVSAIMKRQKRSKMNYELQRLNCKVVNVVIDGQNTDEDCNKEYCKLGCICQSLRCETFTETHCRKFNCMFECKCPKAKSRGLGEEEINLPAGADLLSCETVSRIEDKAKRNLAKEEKEFTQTIICTNDKTIVVGAGGRYKSRRVLKMPKKFTEYVNVSELIPERVAVKKECAPCRVVTQKLNLTGVIPYCLEHKLYNCFCGGKAEYTKAEDKNEQHGKVARKERKRALVEEKEEDGEVLYSATGRPLRKKRYQFVDDDADEKAATEKPQAIVEDSLDESASCQRTTPLSYHYRHTKLDQYSIINILQGDFINNITEADLFKIKLNAKRSALCDSDMLKLALVADKRKQLKMEVTSDQAAMDANRETSQKHKRKQELEVRKDSEEINGDKFKENNIESTFDGEVIVKDPEWLKKLGRRAVLDGYCRLLPYKSLIASFESKLIKIWCLSTNSFKLLINLADKDPPPNFVDIRFAPNKTNVIKWILCNKLPSQYDEDNLSFILMEVKDHFEIKGLCTQVFHSERRQRSVEETVSVEKSSSVDEAASGVIELKHLDVDGVVRVLFLKKQQFVLQELVAEECDNMEDASISPNNIYMWAALPEVYRMYKWKMIYLNRDFAYLYFKKVKYSIKYKDLVSTVEVAKNENCTLIVKNSTLSSAYDHVLFALYFDPHYTDRIFIGPYFKSSSEEDVETLRYVNKSLVSSEDFSRMRGKNDYKVGHWLVERPYKRAVNVVTKTIDLTKNDNKKTKLEEKKIVRSVHHDVIGRPVQDDVIVQPEQDDDAVQPVQDDDTVQPEQDDVAVRPVQNDVAVQPVQYDVTLDQQVIWHDRKPIYVRNCRPRTPNEFNRFIVTNIPNFGYLGAYEDLDGRLEVSWPFERKVLQFVDSRAAKDFLRDRFSQLLQPVPESFKIYVVVLVEIDFEKLKPIDSDFLNGRCVVGEFGIYNIQTISEEFCLKTLRVPKSEISKLFSRKAQDFLREKVEELAELIKIDKNSQDYNIISILETAKKEIKRLETNHLDYVKLVEIMENNVVKKMTLLHKLISELPRERRNVESLVLSNAIKIRPNKFHSREVIEISDSDDETPNCSMVKEEVKIVPSAPPANILQRRKVLTNDLPYFKPPRYKSILKPAGPTCKKSNESPSTITSSSLQNAPTSVFVSPENISSDAAVLPVETDPLSITPEDVNNLPVLRVKPSSFLLNPSPDTGDHEEPVKEEEKSSEDLEEELATNTIFKGNADEGEAGPEGIKLVKTSDGRFVLVSDKNRITRVFKRISQPSTSSKHRIIIQNNKIVSNKSPNT